MTMRKRALPIGWYPNSAKECDKEIEGFLDGFDFIAGEFRGGIVPHAGWFFSGRAAARVIANMARGTKSDLVVLYGGHLRASSTPIVYTESEWETPYGSLALYKSAAQRLISRKNAVAANAGFNDNTVEIQLPFIKKFFPNSQVLAVHAPASAEAAKLSSAIHDIVQDENISVVYIGSADLTHYGPNYGFFPKGTGPESVRWVKEENDRSLVLKTLNGDFGGVIEDSEEKFNTCSAGPIAAVIASVGLHGIKQGRLLEYYTSYDVMPGNSFVGYAGILF